MLRILRHCGLPNTVDCHMAMWPEHYLVVVQERDLAVPRELAVRMATQGSEGELWSWTLADF